MRKATFDINTEDNRGLSLFEATGFSMWPFFKGGERVIVKRVASEDLKMGDIILYKANNQFICHRLIKKAKDKDRYIFYCRGDNSIFSAERVTEQMYLGKAIGIIKNGKTFSLCTKKQRLINGSVILIAPLISVSMRIYKCLLGKK